MKLIRIITAALFSLLVLLACESWSEEAPSLSVNRGSTIKTIYIDPAYGGQDEGPQLTSSVSSKTVALLLAYKLQTVLEAAGFTVYLSRDNDDFVSMDRRVLAAKSKGADIYIRLKLSKPGKDCITLFVSGMPKKEATRVKRTAKKDELNRDVEGILKGLVADSRLEESVQIARAIKAKTEGLKFISSARIDHAYDYLLLNASMPVVTVDLGISKPDASSYVLDPDNQDAIADAVASGVTDYAQKKPPDNSSSEESN